MAQRTHWKVLFAILYLLGVVRFSLYRFVLQLTIGNLQLTTPSSVGLSFVPPVAPCRDPQKEERECDERFDVSPGRARIARHAHRIQRELAQVIRRQELGERAQPSGQPE